MKKYEKKRIIIIIMHTVGDIFMAGRLFVYICAKSRCTSEREKYSRIKREKSVARGVD